ncbi:MAG: hypothetical protein LBQ88_09490 [Treponema sp.]|jgi:hypothetical protein|nr:hypothetical protein [Treponema sp.]
MIYSTTGLSEKIVMLKAVIEKAVFIIIGAGSGLSSTAGLLYDDFITLNYKTNKTKAGNYEH